MGKKKTRTETHQVTTPSNPEWVTSGLQGLQSKIASTFNGVDPTSFVAGPDPLQTQAGLGASGLNTSGSLAGANGAFASLANPGSILDNLPAYMSPYTNDVVNTSLASYDHNAGQQRGQSMLDLAGDTTFGGSGGSIYRSGLEGELARGRGSLEAGLRDQGFARGAGLAGQDQANRTASISAAGQGYLGANSAERSNVGMQSDIGSILQQLAQARAQAPVTALGTQTALTASLPYNLFNGNRVDGTGTQTTSDPAGTAGKAIKTAAQIAALFSDRRLKRDIERIGTRPDGLGVYAFRYLWSPLRHVGVMAQEVLKVKPEAVLTTPSGFMAVDYGML